MSSRALRALAAAAILLASCLAVVTATPVPAGALTTATQISPGGQTTCAVMNGGAAYCWGDNSLGQFGNGTTTSGATPMLVSGGYTWASISTEVDPSDLIPTTCGVTTTGVGYCWGANAYGNVGDGTTTQRSTPTAVSGGYTWSTISVGMGHVCGVTTTGVGYCWGGNTQGQLGDTTSTDRHSPTAVSGGHVWSSIYAGSQTTCGVTTAGAGYCWGYNYYGDLGIGNTSATATPTSVSGGYTWASISVGYEDTCGVTTGGAGYCWGRNSNGEDGNNTTTEQDSPGVVSGGYAWSTISTGTAVTCGVTTAGAGYCWGTNWSGQGGDGTGFNHSIPSAVAGGYTFTSIVTDGNFTQATSCGLARDGIVYCWGENGNSQIGDGTTNDGYVPVESSLLFAAVNNTIASVTVDPSFTFTVANQSSACNGESNFVSGAGTASAVALAHLAAGANASGGQALSVAGNAGGGFVVYVRGPQASQNLRNAGHNWADVAGTYVTPAILGAGERFGYTYKDSTSSSSVTNPASAKFIALTSSPTDAVMGSGSSVTGSGCVSYDAQTAASTPAGSYAATIIYTAVPAY